MGSKAFRKVEPDKTTQYDGGQIARPNRHFVTQ